MGRLRVIWVVCVLAILGHPWRPAHPSFAVSRRQANLSKLREKAGLALHTKARDDPANARSLSDEGRKLLLEMSDAGARGDWQRIKAMVSKYQGEEIQVFNSAMHFAVQCGQYREGSQMYERLSSLQIAKTRPTFTAALKLFSELGEFDAVREVWAEAKSTCEIGEPESGARIDAAAVEGDIETAAAVLDEMNRRQIEIGVRHMTAAMRACWEAKGNGHNAARHLFGVMLDLDLSPNIVTMTCLAGAYQSAPLADVLGMEADMKKFDIVPNTIFAEVFLCSILQKPAAAGWSLDELVSDVLPRKSPERLAAARSAIKKFRATGLKLTRLTERIELALRKIPDAGTATS